MLFTRHLLNHVMLTLTSAKRHQVNPLNGHHDDSRLASCPMSEKGALGTPFYSNTRENMDFHMATVNADLRAQYMIKEACFWLLDLPACMLPLLITLTGKLRVTWYILHMGLAQQIAERQA